MRRLGAKLQHTSLKRHTVLVEESRAPPQIYFPETALVSLVKTMHDGRIAEVGAVGQEGLVGVPVLLGMNQPSFEAIVQVDGSAHRVDSSWLHAEVDRSDFLRELVLRYMEYSVSQIAQTAACNRLHSLRQRCCRWLLTTQDNVQSATFTLTHEFLALMMGVNRPPLSITLKRLQDVGIIKYRYTHVTISDRQALEKGSCECYDTLRREADLVYSS